ncbi:DUF4136 domain-containing protein [Nitrosospira sp. NRS527]|uniref:DUF4136 domain-containing protein n=1 Tax=Nitrosospira sp. NRS527 TaxID=155925 RepID=UPI001AF44412|nr:DUF4136 domain-containing protein [Nitrosospira sp. NRS527]BCT67324.1 hypothetical protein NNRS527_00906 [Nitrosospira sp. NRS527]
MLKTSIILTMLLLTGCATTIQSRVTVFHELSSEPKTFAFIQLKEQEGSLEHKRYEELVRSRLVQRGFNEVTLSEANYAVGIAYSIGSQQVTGSYPIFGQTGVSSATTYGSMSAYGNTGTYSGTTTYTPRYGVVGSQTYTSTVYKRQLNLTFYDKKYFDEQRKLRSVYEIRQIGLKIVWFPPYRRS